MKSILNSIFFKQFLFWFAVVFMVVLYSDFARFGLPDASGVGRKDDQSIALVILAIIVFLLSFSHVVAKILVSLVMLIVSLFAIINWWFYDFYRDYLTFSIYKLAAYAGESSLAWGGLKYKTDALIFVVSMLVMLLIIFRLSRYKPKKRTLLIVSFIILLLGFQQQYVASTRALGGLKHRGVNHISYFIKSFYPKKQKQITDNHLVSLNKALKRTDVGEADKNYPLFKKITAKNGGNNKNVILVVMESMRAFETGLYADDAESITPNLKKLSKESLNFTQFYANSNQTVRGEVALLCSALDYINGAPYSMSGASLSTNCLPSILAENGYDTFWIHGYKKSFFNREAFFPKLGYQHINDRAVIDPDNTKEQIGWGIKDEEVFAYAINTLENTQGPFFAEIMTLSNHYPYLWDWGIEFPDNLKLQQSLNEDTDNIYPAYKRGIYYTDYALGQFIESFKNSKLYDNTILIVTGDHGIWSFTDELLSKSDMDSEFKRNEMYFRLPLLIHSKDIAASVNSVPASQIDVAPTILDYLDIEHSNAFMGNSLFSLTKEDEKSIFFIAAGSFGFRNNDLYCYPIDTTDSCKSEYRKCDSYAISENESACVKYSGDLLTSTDALEVISVDQSSEKDLIDLSQHYLEYGFLPKEFLIQK